MRGVVAVAFALLLPMFASGCFVQDKDPQTQDTDGAETATQTSGTTTRSGTATPSNGTVRPGGNGTDRAPTANLTASPVNGTAPLNVTFSIGGADPEGGNLTWTLTLGNATVGNGTSVPTNHTHQFTEAGNYTVVLTVSDGANNATANVTVTVTAGGSGAAGPVEHQFVTVNPDGTCDAKGERTVGPIHIHDRPTSSPQPGFTAGDGTWVYEESNSKPGLQIGGPDESDQWKDCKNPDTLLF
jgi:PKD repeat protein